ncbi:FAD binding protein [Aureococcus anophagefferens]|nr:FAD binding protein [Aureococcus anophagefferens]
MMLALQRLPDMMLALLYIAATAHALAPTAVPTRVDVAIAGGGLGGLAACAALRARGIDAHCFEAAGELLRGSTGTGIMISANGMSALGAVDRRLPAAMRARGVRITSQKITKYGADGAEETSASMDATTFKDTFGHDQYNIAWSSAHEALADVVPPEVVHCGRAVAGATAAEGGVDVAFVDGSSVRAKLLVGADGIGSKVRSLVATGDEAPRYSGQLLWNAIVDRAALPLHGPGEVSFATTGVDGRAILAFDAGGGKTSWYLTLPATEAPRSRRPSPTAPSAASAAPAAAKAFAARRGKRCDMVQKYSAASYMGKTSPTRQPRKIFRMLGNFRRIKQMYSWKHTLDELPGEPCARWAWSGPVVRD